MDLIARKNINNTHPYWNIDNNIQTNPWTPDISGLSQRMGNVYNVAHDPGNQGINLSHTPFQAPTTLPYKDIPKLSDASYFAYADPDDQATQNRIDNVKAAKKAATMEKLGNVANVAGTAVQGGITMAQDLGSYTPNFTVQDLANRAGTRQEQVGDQTVTLQNFVNENEVMGEYNSQLNGQVLGSAGKGAATGAAIGSALGPIGGAVGGVVGAVGGLVGGLFGKSKAKREAERRIREQQQRANINNQFRVDVARTSTLNNDYVLKHGNTENQILYREGKQPNGLVQPGEKIQRVNDYGQVINQITVPGNPAWGDVIPVRLGDKDAVISNKYGLADQADVDPNGALYRQGILKKSGMMKDDMKEHKCGKMPKYKLGKSSDYVLNAAAHGIGGLIGLQQYLQAKNSDVYKPNTYVRNPYANRGLGILGSLRINPYPIMNQLRAGEARGNYALNNSGGLSGSQKYLGKIANVRNTQQSIADAMMKMQEQNNAYKSQYGNSLLTIGAQEAANMMNTMRADNDIYMRSHAARQQGMETGVYNMQNNLLSWLANYNKLNQFDRTMAMYQGNQNLERQKIKALFG